MITPLPSRTSASSAPGPSVAAFDPPAPIADAIIDALGDPTYTLRDVASMFETTVEHITRWMQREDIRDRLDAIEAAVARRTRLFAVNALPMLVQALIAQIQNQHHEESHALLKPGDTKSADLLRRARESTRKAASLLARIAKFTPGQSVPGQPTPRASSKSKITAPRPGPCENETKSRIHLHSTHIATHHTHTRETPSHAHASATSQFAMPPSPASQPPESPSPSTDPDR
jgi:hypothetical protein